MTLDLELADLGDAVQAFRDEANIIDLPLAVRTFRDAAADAGFNRAAQYDAIFAVLRRYYTGVAPLH